MAYNNDRRNDRRGRGGEEPSEFTEKVVSLNRVSKTVKGGRVMKFAALMVVGDEKGRVGFGTGKAAEVPEAIRKGATLARRSMVRIPMNGGTIAHPLIAEYSAARVMLKPASHGTGVIAGGAVRAIMESAGVTDVLAKSLGSRNPINVARATIQGLGELRDPRGARERRLAVARGS